VTGLDFAEELLTGWLNTNPFISSVTVGGFEDLGYNVIAVPVPEPTSVILALAGLALGLGRHQR
jgi:hypothetical protein